jgi:hypothetical protein
MIVLQNLELNSAFIETTNKLLSLATGGLSAKGIAWKLFTIGREN